MDVDVQAKCTAPCLTSSLTKGRLHVYSGVAQIWEQNMTVAKRPVLQVIAHKFEYMCLLCQEWNKQQSNDSNMESVRYYVCYERWKRNHG